MTRRFLSSVAAMAMAAGVARAQQPDMQAKVAAFKQQVSENMAALHKYQWLQTTTVALKGEVKQTQVASCSYQGPGKPVCTEVSSTPSEAPHGGPMMKHAIEKKIAEMKAYMDSVKTLVGMYVPPNAEKIEAARASGNIAVSQNPMTNTTSILISNYAEQGDKLTVAISDATKKVSALNVDTWLGAPSGVVSLAVTFATLGDGTNYAAKKVLNATANDIVVTITDEQFALKP
jgi:hypothetical protein